MINYKRDIKGMEYSDIVQTFYDDLGISEDFFTFSEEDLLPYESILNIDTAYSVLNNAILNNHKITVHADCDCDGVCAGTIMYQYLLHYTNNINIIINDGKKHGLESVDNIDCDLLIVVDSINKADVYKRFSDTNIIVLDHHIIEEEPPENVILVSSMRSDNKSLSGAGITWKFCKYYDLMEFENYADEYVDLAAVGLIGDMMDMSNKENRYICDCGFKHIVNPAVKKIIGGYEFNAKSVSFSIAPLINACNRLHKNELALTMFNEQEPKVVSKMLKEMKEIKAEQDYVINTVDENDFDIHDKFIVYVSDKEDLSGVLANKISGIYKRPALVIRHKEDMIYGSMRGYGLENFSKFLEDTGHCTCQGHENAAGIIIKEADFDKFIIKLDEIMANVTIEERSEADYLIDIEQIPLLMNISKMINRISGEGFKGITFAVETDKFDYATMSDGKHMKLMCDGNINLIKWNDSTLPGNKIRCCGTLDTSWFGRTFTKNMIIDKIEVAE